MCAERRGRARCLGLHTIFRYRAQLGNASNRSRNRTVDASTSVARAWASQGSLSGECGAVRGRARVGRLSKLSPCRISGGAYHSTCGRGRIYWRGAAWQACSAR